jgi:transposase
MGHQQVEQAALFKEFSLERHVPTNRLLRSLDRFVELGELRRELSRFYSAIGRPSIAPELMIRMLLVGYCFGIRSERRLCEEVHLNLAYALATRRQAPWLQQHLQRNWQDRSAADKFLKRKKSGTSLVQLRLAFVATSLEYQAKASLRSREDCASCRPKSG